VAFDSKVSHMARWQELYQQACDFAAKMPTPDLDQETRRIWILIGALSEAFWRRLDEPGFSAFEKMCRNAQAYQAESADEIAIWNELTAPHNYPALVRYVDLRQGREYAGGMLEVARRRWETEGRQVNLPDTT
jgi:hypothetical protein